MHVSPHTIETFNLTSVQVAGEMALGALQDSTANVAIATTGIQTYDDPVSLAGATTLSAGGAVTFTGTLDGKPEKLTSRITYVWRITD